MCGFLYSILSLSPPFFFRYLQEYQALGTAGGIYHFRDQISSGNPDAFFVLNGDVCGDFPLQEMLDFHTNLTTPSLITIMGTEATRQQSTMYGCIGKCTLEHMSVFSLTF